MSAVAQSSEDVFATLQGVWTFEKVNYTINNKDTLKLSGKLPDKLYYTCPHEIEFTSQHDAVFRYIDKEPNNIYYRIDEHTKFGERIFISEHGASSVPLFQYFCFIRIQKAKLMLISTFNDNFTNTAEKTYIYIYSKKKTSDK
jgi:hypothetical protein